MLLSRIRFVAPVDDSTYLCTYSGMGRMGSFLPKGEGRAREKIVAGSGSTDAAFQLFLLSPATSSQLAKTIPNQATLTLAWF